MKTNPQEDVVNLRLSRKLQEANIHIISEFSWVGDDKIKKLVFKTDRGYFMKTGENLDNLRFKYQYPAPLATEMLKKIGDIFLAADINHAIDIWTVSTKTHGCDCDKCKKALKKDPDFFAVNWEVEKDKNLPNALAKLLISLKKKKLI